MNLFKALLAPNIRFCSYFCLFDVIGELVDGKAKLINFH